MKTVKLNQINTFTNLPEGAGEQPVNLYTNPSAKDQTNVPAVKTNYLFRKSLLRDIVAFWNSDTAIAMKLKGPKGSGKTTLPEQFCARLRSPLLSQTCDQSMDRNSFLGMYVLTSNGKEDAQPTMKFVMGGVLKAAVNGWPVLLNEYNNLDPNAASALNDLLEGKAVYVEQLGRSITPKKGFKVFATMNPESEQGYAGRHEQDSANDDRFWAVDVPYLDPEEEKPLVTSYLISLGQEEQVAEVTAELLVDIANNVRNVYMGNSPDAAALDVTISTRGLLTCAEMMCTFASLVDDDVSPLHYAFERSISGHSKSQETKVALHQIVTEVSNEEYKV